MKKFFVVFSALAMLGFGCMPATVVETLRGTDSEEMWIVTQVSDKKIEYKQIEWFSGEDAVRAAQEDGCTPEQACAPGGFYWRYKHGLDVPHIWNLGLTSSISVKLICNAEVCGPEGASGTGIAAVSFEEYLAADALCRNEPEDCSYYGLGTGMDFFQVHFRYGRIDEIVAWYVP